jgi:hypothetical protein
MDSNTPNLRLIGGAPADDGTARIEAALDRLARAEAASAPAGFEDRVAHAVRAGAAAPIPMSRGVRARLFTPLRAAACLALVGTAVGVYVATLGGPGRTPELAGAPAPSLDAAVGELLAVAALHGEDDTFSTQVESFLADTERVGQGFEIEPGSDPESGQGAM